MKSLAIVPFALILAACGPTMTGGGDDDDDDDDTIDSGSPPGTPDGGGGPPPEFIDAAVCDQTVPVSVTVVGDPPDMLLIVDKSGSMQEPLDIFMPFVTKWSVMRTALANVVAAKDDQINFGLMLYPSDAECGPGSVSVPIAPLNAAPITSVVNGTSPNGATPTHTTVDAARAHFASIPVNPDGRFALLATDGLPNCNGMPDVSSLSETVAAIAALAADGVPTFVVGFGASITSDPSALNMMAAAGGTGMPYSASSPAELEMALDLISGMVVVPSCTYELADVPNDPSLLSVTFDGVPVPRSPSHTNGWDYDPTTNTITFYGTACDELQSGTVASVHVDYGCGGPVID
jgi:hypothetical protein